MNRIIGYTATLSLLCMVCACDENRYQALIDEETAPVCLTVDMDSSLPEATRSGEGQEIFDADGNVLAVLTELEEQTPVFVPSDSANGTKANLVNDLTTMRTYLGNTFTVSAYKGGTALFSGETATYQSGSKWTLGTARRWPVGETYEFFGYTTSTPAVTFNPGGSPSTASIASYTTPASASSQIDFLLGYYKGQGASGAAPMHFTHPLTSVKFEFVSFPDGIKIKRISLTGIKNSGSCVAQFTNADGKTPTYTWTPGSSTSTFQQEFSSVAPASVQAVPFVLIPQTFAAGSASSIEILASYGGVDKTISVKIAPTAAKTWKAGTTYIFRLSYSVATGIKVEDTVDGKVKKDLAVTNTGTAPEYIRIALVGSWKDSDGKIVAPWDKTQGTFSNFNSTEWILGSDGFYYYKYPVLGGNATANALFQQYQAPANAPVTGAKLEISVIGQAVIWDETKAKVSASWPAAPLSSLSATPEN